MNIVGIDEVGRGCWAGPVVAGAVILHQAIPGLADSKVLTKKQRELLAVQIHATAQAVGLGWVTAAEVDALGLTAAVRLAMQQALAAITEPYDGIIIDGNYNFLHEYRASEAIVKADGTIPCVSAASIIAKVARDAYMAELHDAELYGYKTHVGYGTKLHQERLRLHGVSGQHRKSFKPIAALLQ
ncbi:MAG: ribonuclease HII [Patescibacteria group bacterium]|nr:ribonuclease HII [Patescibacteria group bacterium]